MRERKRKTTNRRVRRGRSTGSAIRSLGAECQSGSRHPRVQYERAAVVVSLFNTFLRCAPFNVLHPFNRNNNLSPLVYQSVSRSVCLPVGFSVHSLIFLSLSLFLFRSSVARSVIVREARKKKREREKKKRARSLIITSALLVITPHTALSLPPIRSLFRRIRVVCSRSPGSAKDSQPARRAHG